MAYNLPDTIAVQEFDPERVPCEMVFQCIRLLDVELEMARKCGVEGYN